MTNSTTQPRGDSVSPLRGEEDHGYLLGRERDAELCGQEVKGSVQAGNMALGLGQLLAKLELGFFFSCL